VSAGRSDPVHEAAAAAGRGELIVMPTDTVYGLGTRPDRLEATEREFAAKRRSKDLELPVLVASILEAERVAVIDERSAAIAGAHWPGGLTLVLPRGRDAAGWDLGGDPTTVGVRIPSHPLALAVLRAAGPLAMSSANISGQPPAKTCQELRRNFDALVAVYLCEELPLTGEASTVLDLAHGPARLVRPGAVPAGVIADSLPHGEPLLDSRPSP
jgi:L-threonylcarbamoyladenylate synthase